MMAGRRWAVAASLFLSLPFVSLSVGAEAPAERRLVVLSAPVDRQVEQLRSLQAEVVARVRTLTRPSVLATLDAERTLAAKRSLAARLLAEAAHLCQRMQYEGGLSKLEAAERAAVAGLSRLVDPRLLAEIYRQRGIALLPTDREAGRRWLVLSFRLWPTYRADEQQLSPKILGALRRAAADAAPQPMLEVSDQDGARAARLSGAGALLIISVRLGDVGEEVRLALFDARRGGWRGAVTFAWPHDRGPERIRTDLERAVRSLLPAPAAATARTGTTGRPASRGPRPRRGPPRRHVAAWAIAGAGVLALAGGTAFALAARSRENAVESMAGQSPLVEYDPVISDLEDSGRRYQVGAIVCFSVAGVAAAAALYLALAPKRDRSALARLRVPQGGGVGLALDLP